ncbi:MAG: glycosyltransferase [Elainella sp. Prado103]|jgi:glycosyltransferase involved in cell wall biosynthesis/Tfp pilus assembly protein PilF|nr:glycosyltransferase [Elainella sp. Prado103]
MLEFLSRSLHPFIPPRLRQPLKETYQKLQVQLHRSRSAQHPTDPAIAHQLAVALVERGDWIAAIQICEEALQHDPSFIWLYKTLAEAYLGQGRWEAAITTIQQAIHQDDSVAWFYQTLAKAQMGQENWAAAIEACQQAIQRDPSVSWFYYHLGEAQVKGGFWAAAIPNLERAIELDANFAWAYYYLAEAWLAQGQMTTAIDLYRQVTQTHPEIAYLQDCLAYAQHLHQQEHRIQQFCQQAQKRDQQGRSDRLRILMLTPYPPYPPKLGAISRMFHEMHGLGKRHELVVFSLMFVKGDYVLETQLEQHCQLGIMVMIGDALPRSADQPALIHRYSSERMRSLLQSIEPANFDIVLCDFIYMAQYIDLFPQAFHILGEHNIESRLLRRCALVQQNQDQLQQIAQQVAAVRAFVESDREADLLAQFEDHYWPKFSLRMVVSEQDQLEMAERCPSGKTMIVNNGIDTQQIQLLPPSSQRQILFIGTLSYYPNIDGATYFVEQILPLVWQQDPSVRLCIAGADPPQTLLDLAEEPRIQVVANPDDMSDIARQAAITIVPLRIGSGTRIKILHSMAMGLPVISTSLGCEGLDVTDGVHLLIRDQPETFATGVLQLLDQPTLRQTLRQQGRQRVEQHYDWQQVFEAAERQIVAEFWQSRIPS